jgi:2-iminobutanoate/2-iminopropanoate deaminase
VPSTGGRAQFRGRVRPTRRGGHVALELKGIVVRVADLAAARARYTQVFGCEPVDTPEDSFAARGQVEGFRFEVGMGFVQFVAGIGDDSPVSQATAKRGEGLSQVAFWVADVDAEVERLRAAGIEFTSEPRDLPMGRMVFGHPRSLNGIVWELEQHPVEELAAARGGGVEVGEQQADERAVVRFGLAEETSYGFAQAVDVGGLVFVSGQVGVDGDERPVDVEAQMRIAYRRIARALAERGLSLADVVDETLYVTDLRSASAAARVVRAEAYGSQIDVASTLIGVAGIGSPDARVPLLVEIRCTAVRRAPAPMHR